MFSCQISFLDACLLHTMMIEVKIFAPKGVGVFQRCAPCVIPTYLCGKIVVCAGWTTAVVCEDTNKTRHLRGAQLRSSSKPFARTDPRSTWCRDHRPHKKSRATKARATQGPSRNQPLSTAPRLFSSLLPPPPPLYRRPPRAGPAARREAASQARSQPAAPCLLVALVAVPGGTPKKRRTAGESS